MIYTITVNPCLDVLRFLAVRDPDAGIPPDTYRPGDPNKHEKQRPGGKGIDVSRALVCLRTGTRALGFIGDATGRIVDGLLSAEGIVSEFIETGVETRTNIIIVLQDEKSQLTNREIRINSRGKEVPPNRYALIYDRCRQIDDARALVISGSLCYQMQDTFYNSLIASARENNRECIIVLDGPEGATAAAMRLPIHRPDFIKPNLREFEDLLRHLTDSEKCLCSAYPLGLSKEAYLEYAFTGARLDGVPTSHVLSEDQMTANWNKLLEHVAWVSSEFNVKAIVSAGPIGCIVPSDQEGGILHAYLPERVDVRTRIGAGDCLVAGFVSEFVKRRDMTSALKSAIAAATARLGVNEYESGPYLNERRYREVHGRVVVDEYSRGEYGTARYRSRLPPELLSERGTRGGELPCGPPAVRDDHPPLRVHSAAS